MVRIVVGLAGSLTRTLKRRMGGWLLMEGIKARKVDKCSTGNVIAHGSVLFVGLNQYTVREILKVIT